MFEIEPPVPYDVMWARPTNENFLQMFFMNG